MQTAVHYKTASLGSVSGILVKFYLEQVYICFSSVVIELIHLNGFVVFRERRQRLGEERVKEWYLAVTVQCYLK